MDEAAASPFEERMDRRQHWERVHAERRPDQVSWYEAEPSVSMELVRATGVPLEARILDVGGGTSLLVDRLLAEGFRNVGVLDISARALQESRRRLGPAAEAVEWIEADVLDFASPRPWTVWHDRAVFHFLVEPVERARYRRALHRAVDDGGHVIVATFGPEGPLRCSGLDTVRWGAEELAAELGPGLRLVEDRIVPHRTPAGAEQQFLYARFARRKEAP